MKRIAKIIDWDESAEETTLFRVIFTDSSKSYWNADIPKAEVKFQQFKESLVDDYNFPESKVKEVEDMVQDLIRQAEWNEAMSQ